MNKFKLFGGLAVGGTLLAGAVGSAAVLNVSGGAVQAADINSVVCDPDGIHIDGYGVELDGLTGQTLHLSGIDADCEGYFVGAQIQTSTGSFNLEAQIPAPGVAGADIELDIPFGQQVPLASIQGVHIVIG